MGDVQADQRTYGFPVAAGYDVELSSPTSAVIPDVIGDPYSPGFPVVAGNDGPEEHSGIQSRPAREGMAYLV